LRQTRTYGNARTKERDMAARIGWEGVFPAVTTQFRDD
jgi:hypothetical protein